MVILGDAAGAWQRGQDRQHQVVGSALAVVLVKIELAGLELSVWYEYHILSFFFNLIHFFTSKIGPGYSFSPKSYNPHLTKGYFPPDNIFGWIRPASLNMVAQSTTLSCVSLQGGSKTGPSSVSSTCGS